MLRSVVIHVFQQVRGSPNSRPAFGTARAHTRIFLAASSEFFARDSRVSWPDKWCPGQILWLEVLRERLRIPEYDSFFYPSNIRGVQRHIRQPRWLKAGAGVIPDTKLRRLSDLQYCQRGSLSSADTLRIKAKGSALGQDQERTGGARGCAGEKTSPRDSADRMACCGRLAGAAAETRCSGADAGANTRSAPKKHSGQCGVSSIAPPSAGDEVGPPGIVFMPCEEHSSICQDTSAGRALASSGQNAFSAKTARASQELKRRV